MTKCETENRKAETVRELTDLADKLPIKDLVALLKIARAYANRKKQA